MSAFTAFMSKLSGLASVSASNDKIPSQQCQYLFMKTSSRHTMEWGFTVSISEVFFKIKYFFGYFDPKIYFLDNKNN